MRVHLQNITQGPVTPAMRRSHVVLASEVHRGRFRSGFPDRFGVYTPNRAPRLGIAWDRRVVKKVRPGSIRFHNSGADEGWPFPTPARGLAWIRCEVDGDPWVFWTTWLLNSWHPVRPDHHTAKRRRVVVDLELPVVRRKVAEWDRRRFSQVGGGDMNSVRWDGNLPHLVQVKDDDLDRAYMSELDHLQRRRFLKVRDDLPKTGVGPTMQHHGIQVAW